MPLPFEMQRRCRAFVRRQVLIDAPWDGPLRFETRDDQCVHHDGHAGDHVTSHNVAFPNERGGLRCQSSYYVHLQDWTLSCERHQDHPGVHTASVGPDAFQRYQWTDSDAQTSPEGLQNVRSGNVTVPQQSPERLHFPPRNADNHSVSTTPGRATGTEERLMNRCTRCGERKAFDEFRWMPSRGSYHSWCRECERAHRRSATPRRRSTSSRSTRGRAFGIEIELVGPSRHVLLAALSNIGIDANSTGYRATNGSRWELKSDCSVAGEGLELVSPKLYGTAGIAELERVLAAINSVGASVNRTCGVHVHIDFRNRTAQQIKNAIRPILRSQDAFYQMVAPSRRSNHYSAPWSARQIESFDATQSLQYLLNCGPRGFVNLGSYNRHGSIEFRSHGASTNFKKLSAWIALLFKAVEYGETHGEAANLGASAQDVVDTLGLAVEHKDALLRFVRAAEALEDAECATVGA